MKELLLLQRQIVALSLVILGLVIAYLGQNLDIRLIMVAAGIPIGTALYITVLNIIELSRYR